MVLVNLIFIFQVNRYVGIKCQYNRNYLTYSGQNLCHWSENLANLHKARQLHTPVTYVYQELYALMDI